MKRGIFSVLEEYCRGDIVPMHMPGHKRNKKFTMGNPYCLDVTEVTGLDDLHNPEGILKERMDWISAKYHSDGSFLLVNGSTCGILSAITACCYHGSRILVARNSHKSVYNAIKLLELKPEYVYPSGEGGEMDTLGIAGIVRPEDVEQALKENPDVSCVVITSPTYEGVVSPIREIADVAHRYHVPLIVDEAHGAHFQWHEAFPETALAAGADLVVESLHKTLPSLTQTAVLHMRKGLVDEDRLRWALQTFQSSSPSYLLMAGIDRCFSYLEKEGAEDFCIYFENLKWFHEKVNGFNHLRLFTSEYQEPSKIVIASDRTPLTGSGLAGQLLEDFNIETEMNCGDYVIAMTSIADERRNFERLAEALLEIDGRVSDRTEKKEKGLRYTWDRPRRRMYSYEAGRCDSEWVPIEKAEGRMAAAQVYLYPPGVPMVVEGEEISGEMVRILRGADMDGQAVRGVREGKVRCL